jgi:hypothetical protein
LRSILNLDLQFSENPEVSETFMALNDPRGGAAGFMEYIEFGKYP